MYTHFNHLATLTNLAVVEVVHSLVEAHTLAVERTLAAGMAAEDMAGTQVAVEGSLLVGAAGGTPVLVVGTL